MLTITKTLEERLNLLDDAIGVGVVFPQASGAKALGKRPEGAAYTLTRLVELGYLSKVGWGDYVLIKNLKKV